MFFCCFKQDSKAEIRNKPQLPNKFAPRNSYSVGNLQNQFSNISDKETTEEKKTPVENSKIDKSAKTLTNSKVVADEEETVMMNLKKAAQKEKEKTVFEKDKQIQEINDPKRKKKKIIESTFEEKTIENRPKTYMTKSDKEKLQKENHEVFKTEKKVKKIENPEENKVNDPKYLNKYKSSNDIQSGEETKKRSRSSKKKNKNNGEFSDQDTENIKYKSKDSGKGRLDEKRKEKSKETNKDELDDSDSDREKTVVRKKK